MKLFLFICLALLACTRPGFARGDLDAYGVSVNDTNPDPGDLVTVRWTAINRTGDFIGSSNQGVMLSTNSTISRGDTRIGTEGLGPLGGLFFADTSPELKIVRIPTSVVPGRTYWIGIYADIDSERAESNESNNASPGVAITIRAGDLYASGLSINDSNPDPGDFVTVTWTAHARDDIPVGSSDQGVLLSPDPTITTDDTLLDTEPLGALGGILASSTLEIRTITIPDDLTPGLTYYLGVYMDYHDVIDESNEGNNAALAGSFAPRGPDLKATGLEANTQAFSEKSTSITTYPGDSLNLEWVAENTGDGATSLFDFSQQAVRWSENDTVTRSDLALEYEPLGILLAGGTSRELRTIAIPASVELGNTYYVGIEADAQHEFLEHDEGNNFSNTISVTIDTPIESHAFELSDFNHLPHLEGGDGSGDLIEDPRLRDTTGDDDPDIGATMNPSRCFAPGDRAYVNLNVRLKLGYVDLFNLQEDVRLTAWYNTSPTQAGATEIGSRELAVGGIKVREINVPWTVPETPGEYYVYLKSEVKIGGEYYTIDEQWLDDGEPIVVSDALPVVLIHGWSDVKGETFGHLEMMIETMWERPVRVFGYETDNIFTTGMGDGPRVDQGYTEIGGNGEFKPSLAIQLGQFLNAPEGPGSAAIGQCDLVAHSMGGLVARNFIRNDIRSGSPASRQVRRLLTMGTPSYGGLFSQRFAGVLNNQAEDLEYGARVTWELHRDWGDPATRDKLPQCLTIVGTNDLALGQYNQSDVVVTCSSGSLENLGFPVYYVPLGHSVAFSPPNVDGLAVIDDPSHESWPALEAFLNTGSGIVPPDEPGHHGNADDVGSLGHPDPLINGALYIAKINGSGNLEPLTGVTLGHTPSGLPITTAGTNSSGIHAVNLVGANAQAVGNRSYTEAQSDAATSSGSFPGMPIRVYAGETTVHVINADGDVHAPGDIDGDTLPDPIEDLIIAHDFGDGITNFTHVGAGDDYDGDGLTELLETAFGSDPTAPDFGMVSIYIDGDVSVVRHPIAAETFGVGVACDFSADLNYSSWTEGGIPTITPDDHMEWRLPLVPGPRMFRIRAVPASP